MSLHSSVAEVRNDFFLSCEKILQINTFVSQQRPTGSMCNIYIGSNREEVFYPPHVEEILCAISVCAVYLHWHSKALKEHSLISKKALKNTSL